MHSCAAAAWNEVLEGIVWLVDVSAFAVLVVDADVHQKSWLLTLCYFGVHTAISLVSFTCAL